MNMAEIINESPQARIISALVENEGPMTMWEIARKSKLTSAEVKNGLRALSNAGGIQKWRKKFCTEMGQHKETWRLAP